jgi:alpha-beta hydrolase superfamily lysophospholipase
MKFKINNNSGLELVGLLSGVKEGDDRELVFICHGLGGFKEQAHIVAYQEAFLSLGFTVVRWDAADSIGESGGKMEKACFSCYFSDLKSVIVWTEKQPWFKSPYFLCGHSLGAAVCLAYTEQFPSRVKGLVSTSAVISGQLWKNNFSKEDLSAWKKRGYRLKESTSKPGVIKKISWQSLINVLDYDSLAGADKLTMPVLLITGDKDKTVPWQQQQLLFNKIPGDKKELLILKNAPHTFRKDADLKKIKSTINSWYKKWFW